MLQVKRQGREKRLPVTLAVSRRRRRGPSYRQKASAGIRRAGYSIVGNILQGSQRGSGTTQRKPRKVAARPGSKRSRLLSLTRLGKKLHEPPRVDLRPLR